jgi:hypothetical protein
MFGNNSAQITTVRGWESGLSRLLGDTVYLFISSSYRFHQNHLRIHQRICHPPAHRPIAFKYKARNHSHICKFLPVTGRGQVHHARHVSFLEIYTLHALTFLSDGKEKGSDDPGAVSSYSQAVSKSFCTCFCSLRSLPVLALPSPFEFPNMLNLPIMDINMFASGIDSTSSLLWKPRNRLLPQLKIIAHFPCSAPLPSKFAASKHHR